MEVNVSMIKEYNNRAFSICEECIPTFVRPNYTTISICNRKSAWAFVSKKNGTYSLSVSKLFNAIDKKEDFDHRLLSCLIHEALHTQKDCMKHTGEWKRLATIINSKYPSYNIQRCDSTNGIVTSLDGVGRTSKVNYTLVCNHCGHNFNYKRKPKYLYSFTHGGGECPYCKGKGFHLASSIIGG